MKRSELEKYLGKHVRITLVYDKVEEGYIYISKNKVDYEWLYEKMINNRED